MERKIIGKYIIDFYECPFMIKIKHGKALITMEFSVLDYHKLKNTTQEKTVEHIIKMKRAELKRNLTKIEKLLNSRE